MNNDPFRDWLGDRADTLTKLSGADTLTKLFGDATASEMAYRADEARFILHRYRDIATDDAETANHADTPDTAEAPRTDDPDDQAAYEAAMAEYRAEIERVLAIEMIPYTGDLNHAWLMYVAEAIAALPKPVKDGEGHA